jgi:hypothetical protein
MLPQFTAESALAPSGRTYRGQSRAATDVGAVPQSIGRGRGMVGDVIGGEVDPPATTCTCPCCQTVNGRLVCC